MDKSWEYSFNRMQHEINNLYSEIDDWEKMSGVNLADYYPTQYEAVQSMPNAVITKSKTGKIIGTDLIQQGPSEFNPPAVVNSNVPNPVYEGNSYRMNGSGGGSGTSVFSSGAKKTGTGAKVFTVAGTALNTICAASLGAKLGKAINSSFGGEYAWTEADWNDWVSDKDSLDQAFFRFLFDIDGNTYLPEDMLGAMYKMLKDMGAYDTNAEVTELPDDMPQGVITDLPIPTTQYVAPIPMDFPSGTPGTWWYTISDNSSTVYITSLWNGSNYVPVAYSRQPFKLSFNPEQGAYPSNATTTTYNGQTFYYKTLGASPSSQYAPSHYQYVRPDTPAMHEMSAVGFAILFGTLAISTGVPGIENEPSSRASTQIDPTTVTGTTPHEITESLKQNYPQLFDDTIYEDIPQEDGSTKRITYLPVPWPSKDEQGNPITGIPSQNDPKTDPETADEDTIKDLLDKIIDFITDPPSTGDGNSPVIATPVGRASSLWKIYNPTQAQLDAFGSWLWDSSFVEQIKKLFNDPMQAIIGVHKVFATPSIGGTATIKVGYLDSQVPSDWVDNQYTTINCGTVNLREYFGNVFDYAPYTRISLYLPFIGIVDLDVADVMRASISIVYHVDVLTGACLADVKVIRDASGGVLYQYSGSAIVTYPVSSGNYMGMVAGVLSVASGIAGTVLSGGALAPALIGGAVGASHLHTDVSHSGGFSGCAGAMGGKKPYIIISRPQSAMADKYKHFTGMPANSHVTLKNCTGLTKVKSVYVDNINATEEEKNMIESLLKTGVLI